jgi:hypothetical protein
MVLVEDVKRPKQHGLHSVIHEGQTHHRPVQRRLLL